MDTWNLQKLKVSDELYIQDLILIEPDNGPKGNIYNNSILGCNCGVIKKKLPMLTTVLDEPSNYPVRVFDVNEIFIGIATTKAEYLTIWNSSSDNQNVGTLFGGFFPFSFILIRNNGPLPDNVFGNPILSNSIITEDEFNIQTEDGEDIITE